METALVAQEAKKDDIFERITLDIFERIKLDLFDQIEAPRLKGYVPPPKVDLKLSEETKAVLRNEILELLKSEVSGIVKSLKPKPEIQTKIIEKVIQAPEKIIEREILNQVEVQKTIQRHVKASMDEFEKSGRGDRFIPAPMLIPSTVGQEGKVLTNHRGQLKWTHGTSEDAYAVTNVTTTRSFDATDTSLDEVASVLGSLIASLQGAGILK